MSTTITYTVDCETCDNQATSTTLDLTNPQPNGTLRIDLEMAAGQATFYCDCGAIVYTDLNKLTEGGDENYEPEETGDEDGHSNGDPGTKLEAEEN